MLVLTLSRLAVAAAAFSAYFLLNRKKGGRRRRKLVDFKEWTSCRGWKFQYFEILNFLNNFKN